MNLAEWTLAGASAGGVAFGVVAWISASPSSNFWGPVHARGSSDGSGVYALTFDDGPTRGSTDAILDALGELNARATFFVVGRNARQCPDLVARMHAEGHIVANHSFDHDRLSMFRGRRYWTRQLAETDRAIEETIGLRPVIFRPPMGVKTNFIMSAVRKSRHAVVTWSRRAMDGVTTTSERILDRVVNSTVGGDVVVLHDGVEPHSRRDPRPSVEAVRPLIQRLRERRLTPTPLDALLALPAYAPARTSTAAT